MEWSYVLTIVGLLADMFGVWGIYKLKIKPLKKPNTKIHPFTNDETKETLKALIRSLNDNIDRTEKEIAISDNKAKKFFALIVIGFIMQLSSAILSIFVYQTNNNSPQRSASHSCEKNR